MAHAQRGPCCEREAHPSAHAPDGADADPSEAKPSRPAKGHKTYPYLLRGLRVDRPNQVWCVDNVYKPMRRGFLYLVAIMDWHAGMVLSWRISNTLDANFCVEALNEAT